MSSLTKLISHTSSYPVSGTKRDILIKNLSYLQNINFVKKFEQNGIIKKRSINTFYTKNNTYGSLFKIWYKYYTKDLSSFITIFSIHDQNFRPVKIRLSNYNYENDNFFAVFSLPENQKIDSSSNYVEFFITHDLLFLQKGRFQLFGIFSILEWEGPLTIVDIYPFIVDVEKSQYDLIKTKLETSIFVNPIIINLIIGFSFFVSYADGNFDYREEETIINTLIKLEKVPLKRSEKLKDELRRFFKEFKYDKFTLDQLCDISNEIMDQKGKETLIKILVEIAKADKIIHENELKIIYYITSKLNISTEFLKNLLSKNLQ